MYKTFDDFFAEGAGVNADERDRFARDWLKKNYRFEQVNSDWVHLISDVHDHDNEPLHFGQVKIASAFTGLTTQLVKVHNVWHLAYLKGSSDVAIIVHPVSEGVGAENEKNRLLVAQLVKNGSVPKVTSPAVKAVTGASAALSDLLDASSAPVDDLEPKSAPLDDKKSTTSVSIDMSAYL